MSGLVSFFHTFLSPRQPTKRIRPVNETDTNLNEKTTTTTSEEDDDSNNSKSPTVVANENNNVNNNDCNNKNLDNINSNNNNDNNINDSYGHNEDDDDEYNKSLASVRRCLDLQSCDEDENSVNNNHNDDLDDIRNIDIMPNNDDVIDHNNSNSNNSRFLTQDDEYGKNESSCQDQEEDQHQINNDNDYTDIEKWREMESGKLKTFIRKRVTEKDDDDGDGDDDDDDDDGDKSEESYYDFFLNDDDDDNNEENNESSPELSPREDYLETQEYHEVISPSWSPPSKESPTHNEILHSTNRKRIPHTSETTNIVNNISDIDLHTNIVNLNSVLILKMTPLLSIKRINHWNTITTTEQRQQVVLSSSSSPSYIEEKSVLVPSMEFYGPLITAYKKYVCCVQLVQQEQVQQQSSSRKKCNKIYIFFYDSFAKYLSKQFKEGDVISITNLPSKCIFPSKYFNVPTSTLLETTLEVDYRTSNYCICIGKRSKYGIETQISADSCDGSSAVSKKVNICFSEDDMDISRMDDDDDVGDTVDNMDTIQQPSLITRISSEEDMTLNRKRSRDGGIDDDENTTYCPLSKRLKTIAEDREVEDEIEDEEQGEEHELDEDQQMMEIDENIPQHVEVALIATQFDTPNNAKNVWSRTDTYIADSESTYHTLAELQSIFESMNYNSSKFFNFYAIILGFTPPIRTHSGDYSMSITLIDQSFGLYTTSLSHSLAAAASPTAVTTNNNTSNHRAITTPTNRVIKVFTLRIFIENLTKAPNIFQAGDVLCAHRISIQGYDNQIQLLGKKKVSSFLSIRPKNNELQQHQEEQINNSSNIIRLNPNEWDVIPTSLHTYTFSPFDETKCFDLWHWGQRRLHNHPTTINVVQFSIHQLLPDDRYTNNPSYTNATTNSNDSNPNSAKQINGDITVLVMAVLKPPVRQNNCSPVGYLRVWDGTGSSKADRLPPSNFNGMNNHTLYEDPFYFLLNEIGDIVNKVKTFHSATDTISTEIEPATTNSFSSVLDAPHELCGKIVNVAIWEESHWKLIESYKLCPGKFIRLRNVNEGCIQFDNNNRMRCIMVHRKSWLTLLPPITFEVSKLLLEHQGRAQRKEPTITCSRRLMLTDISHLERILDNRTHSRYLGDKQLTCIATVASEPPPVIFAVRFFVTTTLPAITEEIGSLRPLCEKSYSSPSEYKFHFVLHICDHTDELDVYVPNEVAERFLQYQAVDLYDTNVNRSDNINQKLFSKMNDLITNQRRIEGIISSKQVVSKKTKKKQHFYMFESLYVDHSTL